MSYARMNQRDTSSDFSFPEPSAPRGYEDVAFSMGAHDSDSALVNKRNRDSIQYQINLVNNEIPFFPGKQMVKSVVTDMDHFPYTRFFRGSPYSDTPTIMEKEAGFRRKMDCYKPVYVTDDGPFPNVCFEAPCSTVYPCNPRYLQKYADAEKINLMLNKACISKWP